MNSDLSSLDTSTAPSAKATGLVSSEVVPKPNFKNGWTRERVKARLKAAGAHFFLSALIAVCVTIPLVFWLYPSPFFEAAGGLNLLGIILGIDVVLGPSLTFLVFDRRKRSLRKDLWIIAACQLAALVYGLYATALSRPVYMTYVVDRFEMVSAAQVDDVELKRAPKELQEVKWGHPQIAYAEQPSDPEERSTVLFAFVHSGLDLKEMFRYYKPLEAAKPQIVSRAKPIKELLQFNEVKKVEEALKPFASQAIVFVPVQGKKRDLTALIDAKTGTLLKVVNLRPWP
jgi:hypothetical protein